MADRSTAMKGNQNARKNGSKISAFVGIAKATPHAIMHGVAQAIKPLKAVLDPNKPVMYQGKPYTELTDSDKLLMTKSMMGQATVGLLDAQMKIIKEVRKSGKARANTERNFKNWEKRNGKVK